MIVRESTETMLYVFSGLPATGKSTLAQLLAPRVGAAYLRIDTIEQALRDLCAVDVQDEGYRLAYRVAADILRSGVSVVADCCNPIALTRRAWEQVARDWRTKWVNVEIVCSDRREHRRRVEQRPASVAGLRLPTWADVVAREYDQWTTARIVIDTANRGERQCLEQLLAELRDYE
jgi:predicted kinase